MSDENKTTVSDGDLDDLGMDLGDLGGDTEPSGETITESEVEFDAAAIAGDEEITADEPASPEGSLSQGEIDALLGGSDPAPADDDGDVTQEEVDALLAGPPGMDDEEPAEEESEPPPPAQSDEEVDEILKSWGTLVGRMINLDFPDGTTADTQPPASPDLTGYKDRDCKVLLGEIPIGMAQYKHDDLEPTFVLKSPLTLDKDQFLSTAFPVEVCLPPVAVDIETADAIQAGSLVPMPDDIYTVYLTMDFFQIAQGELSVSGHHFALRITELLKPNKPAIGLDKPVVPGRLVFGRADSPFQDILQLRPGTSFELDTHYLSPFQLIVGSETYNARLVKTANGWSAQVLPDEAQLVAERERYRRPLVAPGQKASAAKLQSLAAEKPQLTARVLDGLTLSTYWDPGLVPLVLGLLGDAAGPVVDLMQSPPTLPESIGSDDERQHRALLVFQTAFNDQQNEDRLWEKLKSQGLPASAAANIEALYALVNSRKLEKVLELIIQLTPALAYLFISLLAKPRRTVILESLPEELAVALVQRVALAMRAPDPAVCLVLSKQLDRPEFKDSKAPSPEPMGDYDDRIGIGAAAQFLSELDDLGVLTTILTGITEKDEDLGRAIESRITLFEDIVLFDDKAVQKLLKATDQQLWAKALKAVDAEVQQKVFRNMPEDSVAMLREDMDFMGPIRLKDVEAAQKSIVDVIKKLEADGEIVVARAGEDELVM